MTWDEVAALALERLPGVEISSSYGTLALKRGGKLLTRLRPEDGSIVLFEVPPEEREALIAASPDLFYVTPHYKDYPMILARLVALEPEVLMAFLTRRWNRIAPPARRSAGGRRDASRL